MIKKPLIGVVPLWDETKDSYWMLPGYMDGLTQAGGLPIILPLTDDQNEIHQLAGLCDGFLFTGGHDVSPEMYGEEALPECGVICPARDNMETALLKEALALGNPVLGICRGIQLLNIALGGTLYQDLPMQRSSMICHRQEPPYDVPSHTVSVAHGTPLASVLGVEELAVNSCHHQGIKDLAAGLQLMASAPDGLVEAVCLPNAGFVWAVQWHPEFFPRLDEPSQKIFRAFVQAAEE